MKSAAQTRSQRKSRGVPTSAAICGREAGACPESEGSGATAAARIGDSSYISGCEPMPSPVSGAPSPLIGHNRGGKRQGDGVGVGAV